MEQKAEIERLTQILLTYREHSLALSELTEAVFNPSEHVDETTDDTVPTKETDDDIDPSKL